MSDLTDARVDELIRFTVDSRHIDMCAIHTALKELQRHRSARAADEERVRSAVMRLMEDAARAAELVDDRRPYDISYSGRIATRAAKQLASAAVRLTSDDRESLEYAAMLCAPPPSGPSIDPLWAEHITRSAVAVALLNRLLATVRP